MTRWLLAVVALLSLAVPADVLAQNAPVPPSATMPAETKKLDELDALRIEKASLEVQLIQEHFQRNQTEIARIQAEMRFMQEDFQKKTAEVNALTDDAAKKVGLDRKDGWKPNLTTRTWTKSP